MKSKLRSFNLAVASKIFAYVSSFIHVWYCSLSFSFNGTQLGRTGEKVEEDLEKHCL